MLYPANISAAWPHVAPILAPAVERSGTHTIEDVRKSLLNGSAQLWLQWTEKVEAAVVTEIINYPLVSTVRVWLGGAPEPEKGNWAKLNEMIRDFGRLNKCRFIECVGRDGWLKLFPDAEKHAVVMRASLMESENG